MMSCVESLPRAGRVQYTAHLPTLPAYLPTLPAHLPTLPAHSPTLPPPVTHPSAQSSTPVHLFTQPLTSSVTPSHLSHSVPGPHPCACPPVVHFQPPTAYLPAPHRSMRPCAASTTPSRPQAPYACSRPLPTSPMALTLSPSWTPSWLPTTPSLLQLGNAKVHTDILIKTVQAPEAALFAHPSVGKHKVIKVGRHNVHRDGAMSGGGVSIWSSTSLFSLHSWTSGTKNNIKPNVVEMGCKNVLVQVWTQSGLGPDHYRPSLAVPVPVPEIGLGTGLSSLQSSKNGPRPDQTRPNFPNTNPS